MLRNVQQATDFVKHATAIAKDFTLEIKDYQIASGFTLLSYCFHLLMDHDKAIALNSIAYNICKNLLVLVS